MTKPDRRPGERGHSGDGGIVPEPERAPEMAPDHDEISEMLADYATGSLPDGELWRVESHLSGCERCQAEFAALLDLVSLLVVTVPPRATAKARLLAAVAPTPTAGIAPGALPTLPVLREAVGRPREQASRRWTLLRLGGALPAVLGAVALVVLLLLGGWNVLLQRELEERTWVAGLLANPAAAHPLADSELASGARGVFYTEEERPQGVLLASYLPPLGDDQRYQVWLFTEEGERVSGGLFDPNGDGTATAIVEAPSPFGDYWAVGISAEPADGSLAPTSPLVLGGWIQ